MWFLSIQFLGSLGSFLTTSLKSEDFYHSVFFLLEENVILTFETSETSEPRNIIKKKPLELKNLKDQEIFFMYKTMQIGR